MPYSIKKKGNEFCVVKDSDGTEMGCHQTRAAAKKQLTALNIAEDKVDDGAGQKGSYYDTRQLFQREAQYRTVATGVQRCANCRFFAERDYNPCQVVQNNTPYPIVSGGVCNWWQPYPIIDAEGSLTQGDEDVTGEIPAGLSLGERAFVDALKIISDGGRISDNLVTGEERFKLLTENTWAGWWSNNIKDKEREIISRKALLGYIKGCAADPRSMPPLWFVHTPGTKHGQTHQMHPIELSDGRIFALAIGTFDAGKKGSFVEQMKLWYAKQSKITMSHGFKFDRFDYVVDANTGIYNAIDTNELSTTPAAVEANEHTRFEFGG